MSETHEGDQVVRFLVAGDQGDEYTVAFTRRRGEVTASCTCMAGRMGRISCKHREALLDGDVSALLSDNASDVARLPWMLDGTELQRAHQELLRTGTRDGYRDLERAAKDGARRRPKVKVRADIAGTGIKAGMIGEVVERQTAGSRGTSFTHLAPAACLVRFTRRSLEGWGSPDPAPPQRLPVGAEIWLREEEIEPLGEG